MRTPDTIPVTRAYRQRTHLSNGQPQPDRLKPIPISIPEPRSLPTRLKGLLDLFGRSAIALSETEIGANSSGVFPQAPPSAVVSVPPAHYPRKCAGRNQRPRRVSHIVRIAMQRVYLDHNATTPVRQEVLEAMLPYMTDVYGNPSSVHGFGREARVAVDNARDCVAGLLGADPSEIVFTSSGTESVNLAIQGTMSRMVPRGRPYLVTDAIEHEAVLNTCEWARNRFNCRIAVVDVDEYGMFSSGALAEAVTDQTAVVSIMHANNEVGTIQPLDVAADVARAHGALLHTDAVQTAGKKEVNVADMDVDLLSLSAHKFYGPKGVGALYVRRGVRFDPQIYGGSHERNRRAGTENVAGIVGLGVAARLAQNEMHEQAAHVAVLRDALEKRLLVEIPGACVNGHRTERIGGTLNVGFGELDGEAIVHSLDLHGIAVSSGSACASGSSDPSHVLLAMGATDGYARGVTRFSFGRGNTQADVDAVMDVLPEIVARLNSLAADSSVD